MTSPNMWSLDEVAYLDKVAAAIQEAIGPIRVRKMQTVIPAHGRVRCPHCYRVVTFAELGDGRAKMGKVPDLSGYNPPDYRPVHTYDCKARYKRRRVMTIPAEKFVAYPFSTCPICQGTGMVRPIFKGEMIDTDGCREPSGSRNGWCSVTWNGQHYPCKFVEGTAGNRCINCGRPHP